MRPPRLLAHLLLLAFALHATLHAQNVPVVMLSDIHFDPFHDPAKIPQLLAEPIDHWPAILNGSNSLPQDAGLLALQADCRSATLDTAWPLLKTSLAAAHDAQAHPLFVTLSGDLLTHEFPCRFRHTVPNRTSQDLAAFSAKAIAFVLAQLRGTYPHIPIYATLGNNDSGCNDYRETPDDLFLQQAAELLRAATLDPALTLTPEGDYSLSLPAPMQGTRLIVLDDIFESRDFATCAGTPDRTAEATQIDWLREQLADARASNQNVWFMSHIPPGVDVYTSFRRYLFEPAHLCSADPKPFLSDTALPDTLLDYAGTVRLALFGHTHMDEMRLLHRDNPTAPPTAPPSRPEPSATPSSWPGTPKELSSRPERSVVERPAVSNASAEGASQLAIPVKLVPSISPYAGNHPAFLVAAVNARTAILKDWRTFVSPSPEGSTPPWTEAYRFTAAFHVPDFSAESAEKLTNAFTADKTGESTASTAFRQHFYPGDIGLYAFGLDRIWPAFACATREDRPSAVRNCICAIDPPQN